MRSFSPDLLLPIYGLGIIGAFLQVIGAQWDVSWHVLGIVETFLQPAHFVLYAGIGSTAIATLFGLRYALNYEHLPFQGLVQYVLGLTRNNQPYSKMLTGFRIASVGIVLQILAGPFDFYWHSVHGFDPYLFTPAHTILIVGSVVSAAGMFLGTLRLYQAQREGFNITRSRKTLGFLVMLGLATVWLIINFAGYWITDTSGMAYTFGICDISQFNAGTCSFVRDYSLLRDLFSSGIFAGAGVLAFLAARTIFSRKGRFTAVAAIASAVYSVFVLGFMSYILMFGNPPGTFYLSNPSPQIGGAIGLFIPLYLLSLVPIAAFDFLPGMTLSRRTMLVLSGVLGPIVALIDARYTSSIPDFLSSAGIVGLARLIPPEIVGGVIAALLFERLKARLAVVRVRPIAAQLVAREGIRN